MLISALSFVFVFTLIAVSHELGHLIWAKKAGIRVHEFALGFGPRLFSFKKNETVYAINLIPILGYVRIAGEGESPEDQTCPESEKFYNKTALQRFKALFFGPLMNIVLAFVILNIIFLSAGMPKELSSEIATITKNSPAEKAGLMPGDKIIAIDSVPYPKMEDAIARIHQSTGEVLSLSVLRDGKEVVVKATPKYDASMKVSLLGFSAKPVYQRVGIFASIYYAFLQTLSMVALMFWVLWQLIVGSISVSNLAGPLGIAHITGKYAHSGIIALMNFTALISVNVGVLNLLPLPAFDGGRLFFILLELIRKKPIDPHLENKIHQWGLVVILALFVLISINDLFRIFGT